MEPIQREGIAKIFDVFGLMQGKDLIIDKTRCPELDDQIIHKPGKEVADILREWLKGDPMPERPDYEPDIPSARTSAPRPGEVRHAPSPADDAVATEQQLSSICKLCNRLGRPLPDDLAMLSFADAKARIGVLTEEYRKGKASQSASAPVPPQPQAEHAAPTPEDVERMKAYMGRVYGFKQKDFDARWQACKVHVLGKPVADPDVSAGDLLKLRAFAQEREKEQLGAASVSGK